MAERIRSRIEAHTAAFPTILEIPSKDHPYGKKMSLCISVLTVRSRKGYHYEASIKVILGRIISFLFGYHCIKLQASELNIWFAAKTSQHHPSTRMLKNIKDTYQTN